MLREGRVSTTLDNIRTLVRLLREGRGEERGGSGGGESSGRGGKCRAREGVGRGRISRPDVPAC